MNVGKANEKSASEQAVAEMVSKITLKKKKGYKETAPKKKGSSGTIDLDNIPTEFCPVKPISICPTTILESHTTLAQRKHNGHCVFLVKGKKTEKIYSRRMEDLTSVCIHLPFIKEQMDKLQKGTFILSEVTFYHNNLKKEIPRFVAQVIRNEDSLVAMLRYKELLKEGTFECRPFDTLFYKDTFVGDKNYIDRWALLGAMRLSSVVELLPWYGSKSNLVEDARELNWEGFVLRHPEKSQISFSMDGTAHRQGSYKFKFTKPGDFVVIEVLKGKSGKHSHFYSKFHIIEYDTAGKTIDRGYVGPGKLDHDELSQLTKDINSGRQKIPFVVEVEYQSIHDETGKLEFGIIQRIRDDKKPKECIAE